MTVNGSLFRYAFTSEYEGCTDASNTSYAMGWINNFTLGRTTRLQFDANVVGPHRPDAGTRKRRTVTSIWPCGSSCGTTV